MKLDILKQLFIEYDHFIGNGLVEVVVLQWFQLTFTRYYILYQSYSYIIFLNNKYTIIRQGSPRASPSTVYCNTF